MRMREHASARIFDNLGDEIVLKNAFRNKGLFASQISVLILSVLVVISLGITYAIFTDEGSAPMQEDFGVILLNVNYDNHIGEVSSQSSVSVGLSDKITINENIPVKASILGTNEYGDRGNINSYLRFRFEITEHAEEDDEDFEPSPQIQELLDEVSLDVVIQGTSNWLKADDGYVYFVNGGADKELCWNPATNLTLDGVYLNFSDGLFDEEWQGMKLDVKIIVQAFQYDYMPISADVSQIQDKMLCASSLILDYDSEGLDATQAVVKYYNCNASAHTFTQGTTPTISSMIGKASTLRVYSGGAKLIQNLDYQVSGQNVTFLRDLSTSLIFVCDKMQVTLHSRSLDDPEHTTSILKSRSNGEFPTSVNVLTKANFAFMGYFTSQNGLGTQVYDQSGSLINATALNTVTDLYAHFEALQVVMSSNKGTKQYSGANSFTNAVNEAIIDTNIYQATITLYENATINVNASNFYNISRNNLNLVICSTQGASLAYKTVTAVAQSNASNVFRIAGANSSLTIKDINFVGVISGSSYARFATVENSTATLNIRGNASISAFNITGAGGAINVVNGKLEMQGGLIEANVSSTNGGAIANAGTFYMYGGTICGNSAVTGGGIYNQGEFVMYGGTISSNTASDNGGGLAVTNGASSTMHGGVISDNTATNNGGGVHNAGTFETKGGVIGKPESTEVALYQTGKYSNSAKSGGGIYNSGILKLTATPTTYPQIRYNLSTINDVMFGGGGIACIGTGYDILTTKSGSNVPLVIHNRAAYRGGGLKIDRRDGVQRTITAIRFEANAAYWGGALNFDYGSLRLDGDVTIVSNIATYGGGAMWVDATIDIQDADIVNNSTSGTAGGGAIRTNGGARSILTIGANANISNNQATNANGGGIYFVGGTFTIQGGTISNNTSSANGGGIYMHSGTLTMQNGTISSNSSVNGGGIYNIVTLNMQNGVVSGNTASQHGGGIWNSGTFTMTGGLVGDSSKTTYAVVTNASNTSVLCGGGIYNHGTLNIYTTLSSTEHNKPIIAYNMSTTGSDGNASGGGISNRMAGTVYIYAEVGATVVPEIRYNNAMRGGGIYNDAVNDATNALTNKVTLSACDIHHNHSVVGGAFYGRRLSTLEINGARVNISNNSSSNNVGALSVNNGTFVMSAGTISRNSANTYGGGIEIYGGTVATISGGLISENTAKTDGGGLSIINSTVTMTGGTISGNTADRNGGGVYLQTGSLTMTGGTIGDKDKDVVAQNSATNGVNNYSNKAQHGGGIWSGGTFTLNGANAVIAYNVSTNTTNAVSNHFSTGGGGVYTQGAFTFTAGQIRYNYSAFMGGGVVSYNSTTTMNGANAVIRNNQSVSDGGGFYVSSLATLDFSAGCVGDSTKNAVATESNFSNVSQYGAGLYVRGTLNISGTAVVAYNKATKYGAGIMTCWTNDASGSPKAVVNMTAGEVRYNFVVGERGGGVYLHASNNEFYMSGGSVHHNAVTRNIVYSGTYTAHKYADAWGAGICAVESNDVVELSGTASVLSNILTSNVRATGTSDGTTIRQMWARTYGAGIMTTKTVTLTISDSVQIVGNQCVSTNVGSSDTLSAHSSCVGLGIHSSNGTILTISDDVLISSNTYSNSATNSGSGGASVQSYGGGLQLNKVTLNINGGTITNHIVQTAGGGVHTISTNITMTGGTISHNQANECSGIYVQTEGTYNCTFTMSGGTISDNTASNGGGVYIRGVGASVNAFTMSGGTIRDNSVTNCGGGVVMYCNSTATGSITMTAGTISGNIANNTGGGFHLNTGDTATCTLNMSGGIISGNRTTNNGGGVELRTTRSVFNMTGGTISGNNAGTRGGGVTLEGGSTLNMSGGLIGQSTTQRANGTNYSNWARYGGGVFVSNTSSMNLSGSAMISYNSAIGSSNKDGGGICCDGNFSMTGGTVMCNYAAYRGGGIFFNQSGTKTISGGSISNNQSVSNGGGVYVSSGVAVTRSGGTISGNAPNDTYGTFS